MKNILITTLTTLSLMFAPALAAEDLRIGVEGAYPPFSSVDENGNLGGFDIDIAHALCEEMDMSCELIQQDWEGIILALQTKKYDAIIASMSATEERRKQVDFTEHYYKDGAKFVRKVGSGIRVSYKGLGGKTVGVQRGTVTDNFITNEFPGAEVKRYDTLDNAHLDLTQGRLDLVLADQFVNLVFANSHDDYEITGPTYTTSKYFGDIAIAVRQGEDDLRNKLNAAIKAIRANGKYKEINDQYFAFDIYGR